MPEMDTFMGALTRQPDARPPVSPAVATIAKALEANAVSMMELAKALRAAADAVTAPKRVIFGPNGRAIGLAPK